MTCRLLNVRTGITCLMKLFDILSYYYQLDYYVSGKYSTRGFNGYNRLLSLSGILTWYCMDIDLY